MLFESEKHYHYCYGIDEFLRVYQCESAKKMEYSLSYPWRYYQDKRFRMNIFTHEYMIYWMKYEGNTQDMKKSFSHIVNHMNSR